MTTFNGTTTNDTLIGSNLSDLLYGLAGNDSITGGALGDDTLDGGTGSDTLSGGLGNDTYVVDSTKDVILEVGGSDRIQATISIDLNSAAYNNIDHVTLTGTGALNATGDDFVNMLIGNSGANKLDGRGSADTMLGGAGNDTYEVDDKNDVIVELSGDGTDQVNSSADVFTLGAHIENLTLTGTADNRGFGNSLANKITGNSGANILNGAEGNDTLTGNDGFDQLDGGPGADSMSGGHGIDQYSVDDVGDKITEVSASGPEEDDTVSSTISYVLGNYLENLALQGADAIDATGNSLNNRITGNDKANTLSGLAGNDTLIGDGGKDLLMGGDGNDTLQAGNDGDTLVGGAGNDFFTFAATGGQSDVVADFNGLLGGDLLDVSALLTSFDPQTDDINDFLQTAESDGSTTLRIDTKGGANFDDLAVLQGVSTDLAGLLANGAIQFPGVGPGVALVGTSGADTLTAGVTSELVQGLGGNDSLSGGAGFDTLDGGTGSDTMAGGAKGDTYIVDSTRDEISDSGGTDDRIQASITIDLNNVAYDGIEHVTLTGTGALNATGVEFANMLIGNTGANKLDGGTLTDTMIGGAGKDTYTVDDSGDSIVEYANEGTDQVNSSAAKFILSDFVENLTQTGTAGIDGIGNELGNKIAGNIGADTLDGRKGNDTLTGNDGDDTLDGGQGADSLIGGKGGDHYIVDDPGDKISESGPSTDVDTVFASLTYVLGTTLENLVIDGTDALDGTGNALANTITGNTAANVLSGLAGNDSLDGGLEDDLLLGGDGNDTLISNDGTDTLVGGAGSDVFQFGGRNGSTIADFDAFPGGDAIDLASLLPGGLTANDALNFLTMQTIEGSTTLFVDKDGSGLDPRATVVLRGVSTDVAGLLANASIIGVDGLVPTPFVGTSAADTLSVAPGGDSTLLQGLGGNDSLNGGKGSDTLDGGTGSDNLVGGNGSDTYIVDSAKDVIVDASGDDDRIQASISIDLNAAAYAGIEHVTLTGTAALNATGGPDLVSNLLIGNAGNNILDGKGGDDQLAGGAGNDTYIVDSGDDLIFENPGEGTDQVNSSTGYTLAANVENLTLTGTDGNLGEGNDLANKITGNSGANLLVGHDGNDTLTGNEGNDTLDGGPGSDSMTGGIGDDTYSVDSSADKVVESSASGGIDEVDSSITYALGSNLERLTLGLVGNIDGTGNSLDNTITGGFGNNVLSGLAGNDTLTDIGGNDLFFGGDGADTLQASEGADTLVGGAGSDRFAFDANSLNGLDLISDFTSGDVLDVSDLLTGFDPATSNINDFLQADEGNGSTTIKVDSNGGGDHFVAMVVLDGVNIDVMGLLNNGSLVLPDN